MPVTEIRPSGSVCIISSISNLCDQRKTVDYMVHNIVYGCSEVRSEFRKSELFTYRNIKQFRYSKILIFRDSLTFQNFDIPELRFSVILTILHFPICSTNQTRDHIDRRRRPKPLTHAPGQ